MHGTRYVNSNLFDLSKVALVALKDRAENAVPKQDLKVQLLKDLLDARLKYNGTPNLEELHRDQCIAILGYLDTSAK